MTEPALAAAGASGLVIEGEPLLVMLSGGADSVCLLDVCAQLGAQVAALHVNYGLRAAAEQDEAFCRELCERRDVELTVERAWLPREGNTHQHARDARYRAAERVARADYAAAHTASDQAETVLYRLAVSPGRRALLGMEPRRGRLVRPLLHATAEQTRAYCRWRGLDWREDASNDDPRFARARVRNELLGALRSVSPAAEEEVAKSARLPPDEAVVTDAVAAKAIGGLGPGPVVEVAALRALPIAVGRLVLRALAETAAGDARSLSSAQVDAVLALGDAGGSSSVDLGDGLRAVCEYGTLRLGRGGDAPPPGPVALAVPGTAQFGAWTVEATLDGAGEAFVAPGAIDRTITVRSWRDGDRMRPVGLGGSKTLQDLFTDRKVPRALRRCMPVLVCGEAIVWVAGVALDERFAAVQGAEAVGLAARRSQPL
ncbi:MAG: tRNA lysidine(34) synthetase TilS [Thermoleophilaceae bacterium]